MAGNHQNRTWIDGFGDWRHIQQAIVRHESSLQHMEAVKIHATLKQGKTIDENMENQLRKETKTMRKILERVMKLPWF